MRRLTRRLILMVVLTSLAILPATQAAHADTLPDAYTQIINHQVPILADGAPSYLFGDQTIGRYYTGPNGLEIRLTSNGTSITLATVMGIDSASLGTEITGSISTLGSVILRSVPPDAVRTALAKVGMGVGPFTSYELYRLGLQNLCLGITVPTAGLGTTLTRAADLMSARFVDAFKGPYYSDLRVWFESCSLAPSPSQADIRIPVYFPGVAGVVAAQPITPKPPALPRMAFIDSRGSEFRAYDDTAWQFSSGSSVAPSAVAVDSARMGLINNASGALFRTGDNSPWVQIVPPPFQPRAIAVSDTGRMAFIDNRGAWYRPNDNSPWISMSDASVSPSAVAVSGQRMGLINSVSGALYRLNDNSPWIQVVPPSFHPRKIAVSDTGRMGFIDDRGAWYRPNDNSAWQLISGASAGPTDISVSSNRVGLVNSASGAIFRTSDNGPWIQIVGPSFGPTAVAVAG